ncbi:MAG: beta-lactamase family protein [bacterium]|nr:beta-lactamase family protein [bacterium]
MSKTIITVLVTMLALWSFTVDVFAEAPGNTQGKQFKRAAKSLRGYFRKMEKNGELSGSVLITKDGQVLLKEGYGTADYETGRPNRPNTMYAIASMSKSFTAMSILMLEEQGLLSVNDTLDLYFADYPNGENITLKHLLKMNAGIGTMFEADDPVVWANISNYHTPMELLQYFRDDPPLYDPGTQWNYCNSCYVLLGIIIEQITGVTYGEFIRTNLLNPMKMNHTSYDPLGTAFPQKAVPYDNLDTNPPPVSAYFHPTVTFSAGAIFSNVNDMYKWQKAFDMDKEILVSAESIQQMLTPGLGNYGYGWYIENIDICGQERKLYWHWGSYLGYHGFIGRLDDDGIFVYIQQNITSPSLYDQTILMPKFKDVVEIILDSED